MATGEQVRMQAVMQELSIQRNEAFGRCTSLAAALAALGEELKAAKERIAELEKPTGDPAP